jgi:sugar fermentation stimulation protein A
MGDPVEAHLPDPGRLRELLVTGRRVMLRPVTGTARRTSWSLVLVQTPEGTGWVSLDTTLPNRLLARALAEDGLSELPGWKLERAEATVGGSRFDFLLSRAGRKRILEAKSVTLVDNGLALFPDAVTARGTRHVREIEEIVASGAMDGTILFVAQRQDVDAIQAAWEIDPAFARALDAARLQGVQILGRRCRVTPEGVTLLGPVPVLSGESSADTPTPGLRPEQT